MTDLERERDFWKALAEAYRDLAKEEIYVAQRRLGRSIDYSDSWARDAIKLVRARVEAEHAAKPADSFAACYSPPGWVDPDRRD